MKNLLVVLSSCLALGACKKAATAAKEIQQAPVQYVDSLQKDVHKAEDARDKANAAIQQNAQSIDNALKEANEQ